MWVLYTLLLIESFVTIIQGGKEIQQSIMMKLAVISLVLNIIKTFILASNEIGKVKEDNDVEKCNE